MDQYSDLGGVSLIGNKDMSVDSNFLSGNAFITDGRMMKEGEKDVCVISVELADKNQFLMKWRSTADLLDEGKVAFSYEKSEQNVVGVQAEITSGMLMQDATGIALLLYFSLKRLCGISMKKITISAGRNCFSYLIAYFSDF